MNPALSKLCDLFVGHERRQKSTRNHAISELGSEIERVGGGESRVIASSDSPTSSNQ
jgi:hypothetical protein